MKKTILSLAFICCQIMCAGVFAQTPRSVLDRCAAAVSAPSGTTARFTMTSAQYGNSSGTIAVKGQKFYAQTDKMSMWFDGTTLWTYMTQNDEVNVSTPTEQQLQTLNPYNFINLYRTGFTSTMTTAATTYTVHLTANDAQRKIKEAFVTINKTSYAPQEIKMLQGNLWTTFTISGLKTESLDDSMFRFDRSSHPTAEIIDLR